MISSMPAQHPDLPLYTILAGCPPNKTRSPAIWRAPGIGAAPSFPEAAPRPDPQSVTSCPGRAGTASEFAETAPARSMFWTARPTQKLGRLGKDVDPHQEPS